MSENEPAKWAVGLADAFTYQTDVATTKKELELQEKRATKAEESLSRIQHSAWWRLSVPMRRVRSRLRAKSSTQGKTTPIAISAASPVEVAEKRAGALASRLTTVLNEFANGQRADQPQDLAGSLESVAHLLDSRPADKPLAWLAYIAVMAKYPRGEDMLRFHTEVQASGAPTALAQLLAQNSKRPDSWAQTADLELIRDVVVDPTSTSHRDFHTGIQRVVRESVPRWAKKGAVRLIIWGERYVYHLPSPLETWRIMEYVPRVKPKLAEEFPETIPVPWETVVIVPEPTSQQGRAEALACLGEWSGNELCAIFYDTIMYTLPETLMDKSRIGLTNFIPTIRTSKRVSTISHAVGDDLRNFVGSFGNIGLPVPDVAAHPLPMVAEQLSDADYTANLPRLQGVPGLPVVLSVGSLEPRKNQIMTLRAAERLWQEGHQFQLVFIGWGSWRADDIIAEIERAQSRGRPVRIVRRADEELLWTAYRSAKFSIYISIAEGYGLPIAESIAAGTPAITSDYGSMSEVAANGGVVTVNPRSIDSVSDAMRSLLSDADLLAKLNAQAADLPETSWEDYANQTWSWLVEGNRPNG